MPKRKMKPCIPLTCKTDEVLLLYLTLEEYDDVANYLLVWQKSGKEWDDYRRKIDGKLLAKMAKAWAECRRMGLFAPRAIWKDGKAKITFLAAMQVESFRDFSKHGPPIVPEICDYCERICPRRDDNWNLLEGAQPCWKSGGK